MSGAEPSSDKKPGAAKPGRARRKPRRPSDVVKGRLRAHDPFELIRWVAFSQTDPRKALAELVQNSLDAGAKRVHINRVRLRGIPCLRVYDDGEGVIPEMDRAKALKYIATHIGHSRKRSLSPRERLTLMTQGQYGIGLLGFWCIGEALEMRSCVPGQKAHRLVLYRDRPDYHIEPLRGRLPLDERWTEVIVSGLHPETLRLMLASRIADFLASELRGQLLARKVELIVEDRMARGRARRSIQVRPRRYLGDRLDSLSSIEVPGRPPIRLEIYYRGDADPADENEGIAIYAAGTLVAEGFYELKALGLDHSPWTDPRLSGLVDFPGLSVAPGSRRGIVPDENAEAFVRALGPIESKLTDFLDSFAQRKVEEIDKALIRDLQRTFRDFYRQRPSYAMLPVGRDGDLGAGPGSMPGADDQAMAEGSGTVKTQDEDQDVSAGGEDATLGEPDAVIQDLLPPGPLAAVHITPSKLRIEPAVQRGVKALAVDASGRPVEGEVSFDWSVNGPVGQLVDVGPPKGSLCRATFVAASEAAEGTLDVCAISGALQCVAEIQVEVLEERPARNSAEGIPEPEFVDQPGELWRSRMIEGAWQVNSGHRDYRAVADQSRLKLRYLAMLFAKEVVLRNRQDPRLEQPLEQLVEVMSYADQQISSRKKRMRPRNRGKKVEDGERGRT